MRPQLLRPLPLTIKLQQEQLLLLLPLPPLPPLFLLPNAAERLQVVPVLLPVLLFVLRSPNERSSLASIVLKRGTRHRIPKSMRVYHACTCASFA